MNEIKIGSIVKVRKEVEAVGWAERTGDRRPSMTVLEFSGVVTQVNGSILVITAVGGDSSVHTRHVVEVS